MSVSIANVLPYGPTVVSIMLGMNDALYKAETEANDRLYFDGMRHIVSSIKAGAPGVRITLWLGGLMIIAASVMAARSIDLGFRENLRQLGGNVRNRENGLADAPSATGQPSESEPA